ncbi:MAG TPA: ABC transporter substrate-binding protein [Stellaceae bacterium]|jgi:NitT/TauT family transport system substrate-binding protein|nr:ABC transporter substrate-binding protein [Stellaceae bacterium]
MHRSRSAAIALLLLPLFLGRAEAEDKLRVGKAIQNSFNFGMVDVAIGSGTFKANGLDVSPVNFSGAIRVQQALTSNDIDIGASTGQDMGFVFKGLPAKAVGEISHKPYETEMLVKADSSIKSVADLKGKKVGVSNMRGYPSWLVIQLSHHQGWGDDGMTLIATGSQPASMAALKTGQVDAWPGDLGAAIEMTENHEGRGLLNFGDVVPPFVNTALFASDTLIAQHPDLLRRFLKAWYENIAWANAHKKETVDILVPILNLKPETVGRIYDRLMPTESTDGRFNPEAMKTMPSAIVQLGILDSEPNLSTAYTEAYLPKP